MEKAKLIQKIKDGAVNIYSEHELDDMLLSDRTLTIKLGADPSRPDLHLGHTVVLRRLRLFQELGHNVVFVIGDFTGMIGDPSGKSKTRPSLTLEQTREAGMTYFNQVTKILDADKTRIEYNSSWLGKMTFEDVIKLASKYTVARIMERDDFSNRFNNGLPIGMHELFYPLIQGYDSVALNADIEIGGTDQTFNMLVGRSLQTAFEQKPQVVMTFPLIPGLDGKEKMSKSLDNYIGIDEPADIMFEKCMKIPDDILRDFFILTTDIPANETDVIMTDIRDAHFIYAKIITTMYHDEESAKKAKERYTNVAKGDLPEDMPILNIGKDSVSLIKLLRESGFVSSNSEARRLIQGKGVKINGKTVTDVTLNVKIKEPIILKAGKNKFIKLSP